jgi:hypothetical protein
MMRSQKTTPQQELIGRLALIMLALLLAIPATVMMTAGLAVVREAPDSRNVWLLFIIGATSLYLVAGAFVAFAFVPSRDGRGGSPRGFATLSQVFDGFWALVRQVLEHL